MDDLKDQSAVSTTATNGVVESEEVRAQEALLGDTDPSLTSADDVAKALNVDPSHGLSEEEAKRRLAKFGPNELASAPPVPKWKKFLAQFQDPLVYLLIAATIISVIAWFIEKANAQPGAEGGEVLPFDAIVIILILIVNAVLGYMQEAKAEAAVEALAQMTAPQTSVLRDGKVMRINTADVVPGDIIVLAEGDSVSADGRLVNAASLRIAEASLTGESVPVGKKPDTLTEAKALGDRANMIFNGTSVTQGTGRAIVTGTGMNTQVGKIADMLSATEDEIYLMAACVAMEAGDDSYEDKLAVASCIVNRVKSEKWGKTISDVIYADGLFPGASSGLLDKYLAKGPSKSCIKATKDALAGSNNIGDYLFFKAAKHASTGSYSSYKIVGGNCFYKK